MNNKQAYDRWAQDYDQVMNRTRDLEAVALRTMIPKTGFDHVLEIGCGTGKNTQWLHKKARYLTAVDFSERMLEKASEKINASNVGFIQLDIRRKWPFPAENFELITFSLVLEHIEKLDIIFKQAYKGLRQNGLLYIGELHPFKQYGGSKARFDMGNEIFELQCFVHHLSDYYNAAKRNHFDCVEIREWFDDDDRHKTPWLLTLIFKKN